MINLNIEQRLNSWRQLPLLEADKLFSRKGMQHRMQYKTEFARLEELKKRTSYSVTARTQSGKRVELAINQQVDNQEKVETIIRRMRSLAERAMSYQLVIGFETFIGQGFPTIEYASLNPGKIEYLF